eukprot:TRINITY_DN12252_c2_g1_i5.p1 TRINITY_DN12252_c2_g1~~TRINITY_DN12252_c2_g1_i5.p1  ORF type:complete len:133 (-),score=3.34 TRINITY_DN12252_c2_g1_i5:674-1072(-)
MKFMDTQTQDSYCDGHIECPLGSEYHIVCTVVHMTTASNECRQLPTTVPCAQTLLISPIHPQDASATIKSKGVLIVPNSVAYLRVIATVLSRPANLHDASGKYGNFHVPDAIATSKTSGLNSFNRMSLKQEV